MSVQVKWGGGVSSPFLFNRFYQDLINESSQCTGGINNNNVSFTVFCYADDLMLASLTRLQHSIDDVANKYITEYGLRFNPSKTECSIFSNCNLDPHAAWMLNNVKLKVSDSVNYLGVSHAKPNVHFDNRTSACRRSYFVMQGADFNNNNSDIGTSSYVWKAAIRRVLT